ncbi:MAG: heparinase II/III family protein [Candidatus Latescibacterota bacterium]
MRAGFAPACINPALGTAMSGFGGRDRERGCEGIHDDVHVRALYLEHEGKEVLVLGFDLLFFSRDEADRLKGALGRHLDLRPSEVLLNASHSHSGPKVGTWLYVPDSDRLYLQELEGRTVEAARQARAAARQVTVWAGATRSRLPMSRRLRLPDGTVDRTLRPYPAGQVCDALPLCLFRDLAGQPVCLLFSVSCHPSTLGTHLISAEYPGAAIERLDAHLGAPVSLFLQGAGGDAKPSVTAEAGHRPPRFRTGTWEDVAAAGEMVAGEVVGALEAGLTGEERHAEAAVPLLARLTHCFPGWLYHDYWDTVADCDPLYAAWHDRCLPLEWKRSLFTSAYAQDEPRRAAMLQGYWGAGRVHTTTGAVHLLPDVCLAYDLLAGTEALRCGGLRERVERDLILEWIIEAEPFVGGRGQAGNTSNKAPRVYHAQAAVARCLGLPELARAALRGYRAVRDTAFGEDGYCHEAPSYNAMYLGELLRIPETLHGFRWPGRAERRPLDLYRTDPALRRMLRAQLDQVQGDGRYFPLSDTNSPAHDNQGGSAVLEIGLKRFPEHFGAAVPGIYRYRGCDPTEYALLHLDARAVRGPARGAPPDPPLPEICFSHWMTAILRHGSGRSGSDLCLAFNPAGGHRHRHNLTLFYAHRGQAVLGDLGYLWESPLQGWLRSTFSHNLVVVDDQEQLLRTGGERRPALHLTVTSPWVSAVEASSTAYPQCSEYRRLVVLVKGPQGRSLCVDVFRVTGGRRHDYRLFSELASSDAGASGALEFDGVDMPPEPPLCPADAGEPLARVAGLLGVRQAPAPPAWRATFSERGHRYRLWMLSPVDIAATTHGPGQEAMGDEAQVGRRVRYVQAIRQGRDLRSAFVAVHEPAGPDDSLPIRQATRLAVPPRAGLNAVAVRLETEWGTYLVLSEFQREAVVDGMRFHGKLGLVCRTPEGRQWLFTCGAGTCIEAERPAAASGREVFGFADRPARWRGAVARQTGAELVAATPRPAGWTPAPEGVVPYVLLRTARCWTGVPVGTVGRRRIRGQRFPLPAASRFELLAVRSCGCVPHG